MTISSISPTSIIQSVLQSSSVAAPAGAPQDSTEVSAFARSMQQLQQLQSSDPAKFKQVMSEIASKLQDAAGKASGPEAQFLAKEAAQFQQAAQTGQMPQPGAHGHGHHHHHHSQASSGTQAYAASGPSGALGQIISQALQDNGVASAS